MTLLVAINLCQAPYFPCVQHTLIVISQKTLFLPEWRHGADLQRGMSEPQRSTCSWKCVLNLFTPTPTKPSTERNAFHSIPDWPQGCGTSGHNLFSQIHILLRKGHRMPIWDWFLSFVQITVASVDLVQFGICVSKMEQTSRWLMKVIILWWRRTTVSTCHLSAAIKRSASLNSSQ